MTGTSDNNEAHNLRYIAYICSPTNELRGSRKSTTGACMKWAIRRSKAPITGWKYKMQMKCPHCGNRPRVAEHEVYIFDQRSTAQQFIDRQTNDAGRMLEPNTGEWFE